ncbi:MAG: hypothetical protein DRJ60_03430 [Thermoprotei archaeon]|nr:MAG: hypothetical protein DRJ60_03430 [Thermoprotei archaeon]
MPVVAIQREREHDDDRHCGKCVHCQKWSDCLVAIEDRNSRISKPHNLRLLNQEYDVWVCMAPEDSKDPFTILSIGFPNRFWMRIKAQSCSNYRER